MPNARSTWALLIALLIALSLAAACGGSGSSGFDIVAENNTIGSVLETMQCDVLDGLTICPVDSAPTQPNATPAPGQGPQIEAGLRGVDSLDCALAAKGELCRIQFTFSTSGLPPETAYRIAFREIDAASGWTIFPVGDAIGSPAQPTFSTTIDVSSSQNQIQLAVLAFLNPDSAISGPTPTLGASGADFAFVTEPLDVAPLP